MRRFSQNLQKAKYVFVAFLILASMVGQLVLASSSAAAAGTYEGISGGINGAAPDSSLGGGSMSADGRYVVFSSAASNLVPNDTNNSIDVFVYDRELKQTKVVSVTSDGQLGNGLSFDADISADGRHVVFESQAPNLGSAVQNDVNIYEHDLDTGATTLIAQNAVWGTAPKTSSDGRYTTYVTKPIKPDGSDQQLYVYDRVTSNSMLVSSDASGQPADGGSEYAQMSGDGRYVVFDSWATNLVPGHVVLPNGQPSVYIKDLWTGAINQLSPQGYPAYEGVISTDGRYAAYVLFLRTTTPTATQIVRVDLSTYQSTVISEGYGADRPGISSDGSRIAFGEQYTGAYQQGVEVWTAASNSSELVCGPNVAIGSCVLFGSKNVLNDGSVLFQTMTDINGLGGTLYLYHPQVDVTPPTVGTPTWSANPILVGNDATLSALVSDDLSGVAEGEYYIGMDPGVGNGTTMAYGSGNITATLGSSIAPGVYTVGVRAKDAAGNWSSAVTTTLVVYDANTTFSMVGRSRDLVPSLANGDGLPGLINSTQTDAVDYGFTVQYKNGALSSRNGFKLSYATGTNCRKATAINCHDFSLVATSFDWLVVGGVNNAQGWFQGHAIVTVDGVTTNNPFWVTGTDGSRTTPSSNDYIMIKIYAPGADPSTAAPLYQVSGTATSGNSVKIQ